MTRARDQAIETLTELGFTGLEAEVYAALLETSPVTAYRVAQQVGKAAANVYKAVESLANKGAIVIDDGESRMLRAVPPAELLGRLERDFKGARTRAERALARLRGTEEDERVYQLKTRDQVLERANSMLKRAKQIALLDLFPEPLDDLREALRQTAKRGVRTVVQIYREAAVEGAEVVLAPRGEDMLRTWPAQWLNVVVDANEHLLSLMRSDRGEVIQAVWTQSPYLSVIYFSGLASEIQLGALSEKIRAGASNAALRAEQARWTALSTSGVKLTGVTQLRARISSGDHDDE